MTGIGPALARGYTRPRRAVVERRGLQHRLHALARHPRVDLQDDVRFHEFPHLIRRQHQVQGVHETRALRRSRRPFRVYVSRSRRVIRGALDTQAGCGVGDDRPPERTREFSRGESVGGVAAPRHHQQPPPRRPHQRRQFAQIKVRVRV